MSDRDIISSYESERQQALRRIRRDSRGGAGEVIAYLSTSGAPLAVTGDDEALYAKIINPASEPVQVAIAGSGGLAAEIQGNVAHDAADGTSKPVKVGGRAAASILGFGEVAADDRVDAAYDQRGRALVALAGGDQWAKFNSPLATPATTFAVAATGALVGRIGITGGEATDLYVLVYDGLSAAGTLVDRFFLPASGTAVRDYTTEGGLSCGTGCFVALSTVASAVTPPATGGFCHAISQAT